MTFPNTRLRRLRQTAVLRKMVSETTLSVDHLVLPLFVRPGKRVKKPIASMPGQFQRSVDETVREVREAKKLGIPAVILFGIPSKKDERGSEAYDENGIIQAAVREIKNKVPGMIVMTDLCFCEYTSHGHCGIIRRMPASGSFELDNDATLEIIAKTALAQAGAGSDVIAPSGMIDGMVKEIRQVLDANGYQDKLILSYSAKYASAFYGPFREAAESPPQFGDRKTYQMDGSNSGEALREIALDIQEGADMVMVKPALAYLDIIRRVKEKFKVPIAAYNVSGEYAMVKAASRNGWIDEKTIVTEILTSIRRAGANLILTYHAKDIARRIGRMV